MFFKCSLCEEKTARINDLQHQIQNLEKLVFPQKPTQDVTLADREADSILGAGPDLITPEDTIAMEASQLLSGDYDRHPEDVF